MQSSNSRSRMADFEKGTFLWAAEKAKQGHEIRTDVMKDSVIINGLGFPYWKDSKERYSPTIGDIECTDWVVHEEKPLSDKSGYNHHQSITIKVEDVSKAVKRLLNYLEDSKNTCDAPIRGPTSRNNVLNMVKQEAIKIFGEKLA